MLLSLLQRKPFFSICLFRTFFCSCRYLLVVECFVLRCFWCTEDNMTMQVNDIEKERKNNNLFEKNRKYTLKLTQYLKYIQRQHVRMCACVLLIDAFKWILFANLSTVWGSKCSNIQKIYQSREKKEKKIYHSNAENITIQNCWKWMRMMKNECIERKSFAFVDDMKWILYEWIELVFVFMLHHEMNQFRSRKNCW